MNFLKNCLKIVTYVIPLRRSNQNCYNLSNSRKSRAAAFQLVKTKITFLRLYLLHLAEIRAPISLSPPNEIPKIMHFPNFICVKIRIPSSAYHDDNYTLRRVPYHTNYIHFSLCRVPPMLSHAYMPPR